MKIVFFDCFKASENPFILVYVLINRMKKSTYVLVNVFAIAIAVVFALTDLWFVGVFVLLGIAIEFFSGRYKQYVNDDRALEDEEQKNLKKMLFPFKIIGVVIIILIIVVLVRTFF